jgi:DNA-binding CsgD family transcriptional regulator
MDPIRTSISWPGLVSARSSPASMERRMRAASGLLYPRKRSSTSAANAPSVSPSTRSGSRSWRKSGVAHALLDAIDAGATAYLTKSATADQIVEAVRRASIGEVLIPISLFAKALARRRTERAEQLDRDGLAAKFTVRELEVLGLMAGGLDTTAMSQRLGIAPHTIEWHVRHVIQKLKVHSKLQAVISAVHLGLIDLTDQ